MASWVIPAAAATAASLLAASGCAVAPKPFAGSGGALDPGTAHITVGTADQVAVDSVRCSVIGPLTTIDTGDARSGITSVVSNRDELAAQSVQIRSVGGFTGSYNVAVSGTADASLSGRTYSIIGTAEGFTADQPSVRISRAFAIQASC